MKPLDILMYVASGLAGALGLYVTTLNWLAVARRRSWIPIVGGALLCLSLALVPALRWLAWLGLILDFGAVPGLSWALFQWWRRGER